MTVLGTLILRRARIHTLALAEPVSALALREGRIVAIGGDREVWSAVGSDAPTVDLRGGVVLPGFTDAHIHWGSYALLQRQLQLSPTMPIGDVVRAARGHAADRAAGEWIIGRGWDHSDWGRWPTASDLDGAVPDHPVALTRKDGHAVWLNTAALTAAGIGVGTPDPPGGEIERAGGAPTGVLKENAIRLVSEVIPEPGSTERQAAMVDAWPDAWCRGLTGCHDMGFRENALFRDLSTLRESGELGLRFVWYFTESALEEAIGLGLRTGLGDEWLRVGGLKLFLDGTLGSQTADMLAPYEGSTENIGLATLDEDRYRTLVAQAARAGIATAVHAIGDAANRKALDGFDAARRADPDATGRLRQRIEHAQLVDPVDAQRFATLGVVASMQPIHCTQDRPVAERYWGQRTSHAYAWRTMLEAGARIAFGSDAPIETLDVFAGIHAAATRQDGSGEPRAGWHPEQTVSVQDAVLAYTTGPAWASGQERNLGALDVGKHADLIVIDQDPFAVDASDLIDTQVRGTMIEGIWVWQSPEVDFGGPRHAG